MKEIYYVYIIRCSEGRNYIGVTSNLKRRLGEHNNGKSNWTSRFTNWKIIFKREFHSLSEARKFEIFLKKQKGGDKFKEIVKRYNTQRGGAIGSSGGS